MRWVFEAAVDLRNEHGIAYGSVGLYQDITERRQAEDALKYERDLLQTFLDNIPDSVYFKDTQSRFMRINSAQARMLGISSPAEAIAKTDLDFQPAELAQVFIEEERKIVETGEPLENRVEFNPTQDGQPRWLSTTKVPVRAAAGKVVGIIGISRDITEQKMVQEHEQNRRSILENVLRLGQEVTEVKDLPTTLKRIWHGIRYDLHFDRTGLYLYDPDTNSMNGTFGTNNQGEMIDEWHIHIPLNEKISGTEPFIRALKEVDGLYYTHDYEVEHYLLMAQNMSGVKDFAAAVARSGDKPVAVICVDQVISGRLISSEQLEALRLFAGYAGLAIENSRLNDALQIELQQQKQAEEREINRRIMLEKIVKLGKTVTEVTDLRVTLERIWHGIHVELDFDRLAIFLYDQETHSVRGTLGTDNEGTIVEEWDYARSLTQDKPTSFTRALESPDGLFYTSTFASDFVIPEGHEMWGVQDFIAVIAWGGNKPVAIITVDNFPSKRRITSEQVEGLRLFAGYAGLAIQNARLNDALEDDLEHRQTLIDELEAKNAELERFTYTVSHDLKSPLVTITGFLGFIEKDALTGNIDKIKSNIDRISKAAKKMQRLLNDLLELSRIGRLMNAPEDVPFREIVRESLEQVRGRLEENNIRVEVQESLPTVHGDKVRLIEVVQNLVDNAAKFTKDCPDPLITIGSGGLNEKGLPVFFVRDNGIGIASQYHEKIFGLFDKLDPTVEGTGVGLTLVRRIVEVHGGKIWLESQPGVGTTFFFTLPGPSHKE
jgi:PAS domain S-box-containing protein